ncbi:hypothetical protein D3C73_1459390 [compost metagenome]
MPDVLEPEPGFGQRSECGSPDIRRRLPGAGLMVAVAAPALAEDMAVLIAQQGIGLAPAPVDPHIISQWLSLLKFCKHLHH